MKPVARPGPPTISDADFRAFRDFFHLKTGIHFDDSQRHFVDRRLVERIEETGHDGFGSYWIGLRDQTTEGEQQALINALTINETYFFREPHPMDGLVNDMLDEIARRRRPGSRIRIWSIPCSTGEEPFSIAIHVRERWRQAHDFVVEILASDIDTAALKAAQRGVYSPRSVGPLPKPYLARYFRQLPDGHYEISRDLLSAVSFSHVNLNDPHDTRHFRDVDVIFCRNLLIYFDDRSRHTAATALWEALSPGGFVCLGQVESMSPLSSAFTVRRLPDAMVYQKPFV